MSRYVECIFPSHIEIENDLDMSDLCLSSKVNCKTVLSETWNKLDVLIFRDVTDQDPQILFVID